jgi:hypothetical protein
MAQQARISTDKFGNPYQLIGCKDKKSNGFAVGYIELGGKLYKIEPSAAQKDGVLYWVKVTALKKRTAGSM